MGLCYGRLAHDESKWVPAFEDYVTGQAGLPIAPPSIDYSTFVPSWPMYGNDRWGDCEFARVGHMVQAFTAYGKGLVTVPESSVVDMYAAVAGFNPHAGPPGENPTDNGAATLPVLQYWRDVGIKDTAGKRHKIAGFARFRDPRDLGMLNRALNVFGSVAVDVQCSQATEDQFNANEPWTWVPESPVMGDHAICYQRLYAGTTAVDGFVSWGRLQRAARAWTTHNVVDAWVVVSEDFLRANGTDTEGLNLSQLLADMAYVGDAPTQSPEPSAGATPTRPPRRLLRRSQHRL